MKGFLEYKDNVGSVVDVDTKNRIVTGFLSSFNEKKDRVGDIAEYGMFTKTVAEKGPQGNNSILFLNHHDWKQPHGKFAVLEERKEGLYFESEPLPNTTYSNDLIELYSKGIIKEHSFGYVTTKSYQDKERNARRLKEVILFEGSNVTIGANGETPFMGFKSLTIEDINTKSASIISAIRNGNLTDDMCIRLEIAVKQLQKQAYELGKKTLEKENDEPIEITQKTVYEPFANAIKSFQESLK